MTAAVANRPAGKKAKTRAWADLAIALFQKLQALAESAFEDLENPNPEGSDVYASRIDGIASEELSRGIAALTEDTDGRVDFDRARHIAWNVEALVRGAELAGPMWSDTRSAIHKEMLGLIDVFTSSTEDEFVRGINPAESSVAMLHPDITWETRIASGGASADRMVSDCLYEIEDACCRMIDDAHDPNGVAPRGDAEWRNHIHMYAMRMRDLNGLVMSCHDDDGVTMREAHRTVYGKHPAEGEKP